MSETIVALETHDVRFPTSRELDGSDAMNPSPDYSTAYVVIRTSAGAEGHGFVFTIGRGTDIQAAAIGALAGHVVGAAVEPLLADLGGLWRRLCTDSQLRWLGPDKGVQQMAVGAVVNAMWDLRARRAGQPLWRLLAELSPEEIVELVDFRYIDDALTRSEALALLRRAEPDRALRRKHLERDGLPAYTTTPGWLGYDVDKLDRLCREAVAAGFGMVKLKVGRDRADNRRRLARARAAVGPDVRLAIDANQIWGVEEAIEQVRALADTDLAWVEEPTHPDDVLGHAAIARAVAPIPVAAGEHVPNRVMFKQLLAAGSISVCQIDATRVSGVNENIAILLLAAKFGVPVCPHAGGVGLCEVVQHLAMFDFVAVSGDHDGRIIEFADHLHEHFLDPVIIDRGRYRAPTRPGSGARMRPESLASFAHPNGASWRSV